MRRVFWRSVLRGAGRWLLGVTDHLGRALTILALIGIPAGASIATSLGWWAPLVGIGLVFLVALGEGAFRSWNHLADGLINQEAADRSRREFAARCFTWVNEVDTFLDAQRARGPRARYTGGLVAQLSAPPETTEARREQEAHERETVALYIERYRDRGVELFDALVNRGMIIPTNREKVHSPQRRSDVWTAMDSVRTAAERLGP